MKGEKVKKILKDNGYKLTDIAKSLDVRPQSLNDMLEVEDIKTGVLERIATSINKTIYFFFEHDGVQEVTHDPDSKMLEVMEFAKANFELLRDSVKNNSALIETHTKLIESNVELSKSNASATRTTEELIKSNQLLVKTIREVCASGQPSDVMQRLEVIIGQIENFTTHLKIPPAPDVP